MIHSPLVFVMLALWVCLHTVFTIFVTVSAACCSFAVCSLLVPMFDDDLVLPSVAAKLGVEPSFLFPEVIFKKFSSCCVSSDILEVPACLLFQYNPSITWNSVLCKTRIHPLLISLMMLALCHRHSSHYQESLSAKARIQDW